MAISIYSSRIVLKFLGVEDFGIYNLVGGVVALFSSLKVVFSSAIQRFINYTRGLGDEEGVTHVFSLSLLIQLLLAFIFVAIVEVFGLWFIPNKLVIPPGALETALFVFHCSIAASVVSIVSVPFTALVIANERMNFYAYVSIVEAVLRLGIVFLLPILPYIPLRSYAVLILFVQFIVLLVNVLYCKRFKECKVEKYWDAILFRRLASFSGWNFFGNLVFSLVNEGLNIVLNLFGGVVANAARGVTTQVRNAIETISSNLYLASQPFVMQQAATVEINTLSGYISKLSRLIYYVILVTVFPLILYAEQVLSIWLTEIPQYTVSFVRVMLLFELVRSLHSPIEMLFLSIGRLKRYQISEFLVLILSLPLAYYALYWGCPLYTVFLVMTVIEIINLIAIVFVAKSEAGFDVGIYFKTVILRCVKAFIIVASLGFLFYCLTNNSDKYVSIIWLLSYALLSALMIFTLVLDSEEKGIISGFVVKVIKKKIV